MPAEIINLRRARKAKARADKSRQADENRVRHGLSKAERRAGDATRDREARQLDGHRIAPSNDGEDTSSDPKA